MYFPAAFYDWYTWQTYVILRNLPRRGNGEVLKIIGFLAISHRLAVNATQNKVTFKAQGNKLIMFSALV